MKRKTGRKLLGVLLALSMVIGLVPGMSLTAYAEYVCPLCSSTEIVYNEEEGEWFCYGCYMPFDTPAESDGEPEPVADYTRVGNAYRAGDTLPRAYYYAADDAQSVLLTVNQAISSLGGCAVDVGDAVIRLAYGDSSYLYFRPNDWNRFYDSVSAVQIYEGGGTKDDPYKIRPQYTVSFNSNGGSTNPSSQQVWRGDKVTKPDDPTSESGDFAGWYNGNSAWDFDQNTVDYPITLTAHWNVPVTSVSLPDTATLTVDGEAVALTATVEPAEATDKTVKWSTTGGVTLYSDENCTAGNEIGTDATSTLTVYAKGISAGSATVTATSNADSTKTASCDVTVNEAQQQSSGTDVLTREDTGRTGANYVGWSGVTKSSGAIYAGLSAGDHESIQLRSNNNNSGIVTTTSGGKATKVRVVWNSNTTNRRTLNVYGKNSAYSAASDLYGGDQGDLLGTIVCGQSTELTISGDYTYIGMRSNSGAMYLDSITIEWGGSTPATVAVTGVTLNPSTAQTIDVDNKVSFTATVDPDNATDKKVKWSVGGTDAGAVKLYSDEACNNEVGADATDKLTVYAKGISAGSATVTATSNADSTKSASCNVQVNAAAQEASADLRKAIVDFFTPFDCEFVKELIQGDSFGGYPVRGSVSATYNGENADIAYSPTSENSADITISHGGNELRFSVSIETDPETGDSTTVVGPVTYTGDEPTAFSLSFDPAAIDLDGSVRTSVYPAPVAVTSVSLDKTEAQSIDVDGKVSFTATVSPEEATDKTVKWSVGGTDTGAVKLYSDEACKNEVGTAATSTLTVYAKGISAGNAIVTATSNANETKSAVCVVTVNAAVSDNPYASLLNTTTVVKFDNKDWYLIENNSTALNAGTVTLLAKECVAASQYNSSGSYVEYASSTVKTAVDNYYTNSISSNVKTAIVDNKMFLLTKDQANAITNAEVGKCSQFSGTAANYWWLCSPDSIDNYAACVRGADGYVTDNGSGVWVKLGVRPALKLDLSKVTFDSETKTFATAAPALDPVPYMAWDETSKTVKDVEGGCTDYTVVTDSTAAFEDGKWYVVNGEVSVASRITVTGTTNIILCDGAKLNANEGIALTSGKTLNIYGQSNGTGELTARGGENIAGIGGGNKEHAGNVTIHGGVVYATGGTNGAGIGGGNEGNGGNVTINGGKVYATGGTNGAGIGGGNYANGGIVTVNGGTVDAKTIGNTSATSIGYGKYKSNAGSLIVASTHVAYSSDSPINAANKTSATAVQGSGAAMNIARQHYMLVEEGNLHSHSFTYAASGATITATCGAANCGLTSNPTLTIVKPTLTTYGETGKSKAATLTGLQDFNTATGKSLAVTNIKYVGRDGTEYTESTTAPTNAGKYTATITLSGVKTAEGDDKSVAASVDYSIKYAVTFNTNGGSAVPQQLVEAGESATRPTDPTREGNIFGGWFADADFAESYVFDEVTENTTVYAKWGEHRVTWTVREYSIQDVFTGNAPAADSNTTVNLAAETLKPDGATLSWKTETDVSGDVTHTAQFSFPVTLNVNGGTINAGNVESYIYGTGATLPTDVTRAKYDFGGWFDNSELTGTAVTQIGTTATGSKEFWAKWTAVYAVPATVTANNRTYDGTEKPLVTVTGEATGGEMQYAIGTATEATEPYTTSIPAKTDAGTYYVWYKVVGDANHNDTTPVYVEVTISNRPTPSGGGTTPATITIPVSGEGKDAETVNVTVQVTGATATVTSADVDKVLEAKDVGNVTVNVESLNKNVDEVVLPAEMVKKVADAVADKGNDASGLEIKLPSGTVTFDAKTVAALKAQSNGKDVKLHLDKVSETTLNSAQQSTVKVLNTLVVLDAYVTADGKRISDFNGGTATFSVPVKLGDGQTAAGVTAYFVAENGEKTEIPCTYDGKNATGTVTHFSNYVVAYDVAKAQKAEEDAKAVEDTVKDLNALPAAADVKLEDKEAIEKARAAYDALTDEQKAKAPADTLRKLTDAEAALKAAEPEPTPEPGKVSYDDLTEAEKKQAEEIASALGVDKDTAAAMVKAAAELGVSMDTVKLSGDALAKMDVDSSDPKGADFGKLTARVTKRDKKTLTLKWTKQKNADGYLIYGNKCGKDNKMKLLKTIKKNGTVSYTQKKLKKGTYYKYMVVAYKNVNGQKMPIAASVVIHVPTKGGKVTVPKSLTVKQGKKVISKLTVKKGKSVTVKVTENKEDKKLKIKTHRKVKFESSNKKIASVNNSGKITGKKKGKATVWAYAQNGIFKAIQVTVK